MKKKSFSAKLSLNKETISKLNQDEMHEIVGGSQPPSECYSFCNTFCGETCPVCQGQTWDGAHTCNPDIPGCGPQLTGIATCDDTPTCVIGPGEPCNTNWDTCHC